MIDSVGNDLVGDDGSLGACLICGSDNLTIVVNQPTKTNPYPQAKEVMQCGECESVFQLGNWCPTSDQIAERARAVRKLCLRSDRQTRLIEFKESQEWPDDDFEDDFKEDDDDDLH